MKKVLIITESSVTRDYLGGKLESFGLTVSKAANGLDGMVKIRNQDPDLIIMDNDLSRLSGPELLKQKHRDPNTASIPVILLIGKLSKDKVLEMARFNVKKLFAKPIKIDSVLETISSLLGMAFTIDQTPCIIDAHFNEEILFIEVARGFNNEKIDLLRVKIPEILRLYEVTIPKVLIILTNIDVNDEMSPKFEAFLSTIKETTHTPVKGIKILTTSTDISKLVTSTLAFRSVEITTSINEAMDKLLGIKVSDFIEEGLNVVKGDFFLAKKTDPQAGEIGMEFDGDRKPLKIDSGVKVAVVDDDPVIRKLIETALTKSGATVVAYDSGKPFVDELSSSSPDLIFLDLLMPGMDGFSVLEYMKSKSVHIPVIVMSALSQKETVVRALRFGVKSYLTKPLKPDAIMRKTEEILKVSI